MSVNLFSEAPDDFKWSANQLIEVNAYKNNEIHIELNNIQNHLGELKYPLYYLEYESVAYAVPNKKLPKYSNQFQVNQGLSYC